MTATWRDLAEAQSFQRRRLLAAYLSGVAAGPAVEPPGTARPLVLGAVAAGLVVGVEAARGLL